MLTLAEREMAKEYLAGGYDVGKVARRLGLDRSTIRGLQESETPNFTPVSDDGLGKESLRKHIVAVKHVDEPWNNEHPAIVEARSRYDSGSSEICTGRDGNNQILYEIPRNQPAVNRVAYFCRDFGEVS